MYSFSKHKNTEVTSSQSDLLTSVLFISNPIFVTSLFGKYSEYVFCSNTNANFVRSYAFPLHVETYDEQAPKHDIVYMLDCPSCKEQYEAVFFYIAV